MSEIDKYLKEHGIEPKETDYSIGYNFLVWLIKNYHQQTLAHLLEQVEGELNSMGSIEDEYDNGASDAFNVSINIIKRTMEEKGGKG